MRLKFLSFLAIAASIPLALRADSLALGHNDDVVAPVVPLQVWAFPLDEVRLLDGPFKHAQDLDAAYLLALDPDRLTYNFLINAGLPSSAKPLGGWEAPGSEVRGHFVGHYMSACAQMYTTTGDERYKDKGEAVVKALAECQARFTNGYLSAFPESFIERVEQRKPVWAPYYTIHKILAGLLDMHVYCHDDQALAMARKLGDWAIARNSRLSDQQLQALLETEQGGINEGLANLYALTGEKKYLDLSFRFNHHRVVDPLEAGHDDLTGLHANTQIPKIIGLARQYELTGETNLKTGALTFWNTVTSHRSYVIGGDSDGEMFTPTNRLSQMGPNTTETCNTYNMLKLTRHLFCWQPDEAYADYYERALCNHILASQNPDDGMMCYYVPLRAGSRKNFNTPNDDFWCCTATGVENHGKYGDSIYFHNDHQLYINLFIGSDLDWQEKGVQIHQETGFPEDEHSRLTFHCQQPIDLELKLRHPNWAGSFAVSVNGQNIDAGQPGGYVTLQRQWKTGDRIEIEMLFALHKEAFADDSNRVAVLDGPLVLAAPMDAKKLNPGIVTASGYWLTNLKSVPNRFATFQAAVFRVAGQDAPENLTLQPFYQIHRGHYEVYWDQFTPDQWQGREKTYAADLEKRRALEERTVDSVNPGEEQNERDHHEQGEKSNSGDFGDHFYRDAAEGGWFSWDLKTLPGAPQDLDVTYWGDDRGRQFDVLVDGQKLATEHLTASHPGAYFDQIYSLPPGLTQGKDKITVRFQGTNTWVGGVFGIRVMKPAASS